jgi:hypothetical protein
MPGSGLGLLRTPRALPDAPESTRAMLAVPALPVPPAPVSLLPAEAGACSEGAAASEAALGSLERGTVLLSLQQQQGQRGNEGFYEWEIEARQQRTPTVNQLYS